MPGADLSLLLDAADEAGRIAKKYFKNDPQQWDKGDNQGPVTEADLAINDMLEATLRPARADYGWLSEETEDNLARQDANRVFIVDPIDGTRAFIEGSKTFSHSFAISEGKRVVAAVVHLPLLGKTYAAEAGKGATLNGAPIQPSQRAEIEGASVLSNKMAMREELWPGGVPPIDRHFRSSLAYRLCLVADGRFDGMMTLRDTWEWDIAAGTLIVEEAGGSISAKTGETLAFNNPVPTQPGVIAGGQDIHEALLARL